MSIPPSSSAALHELLSELYKGRVAGRNSVFQAWADHSDIDLETAEFCRLHADSLVLLTETFDEVALLSEEKQKPYLPYLESWWTALVQPRYDWSTSNGPHLEDANLHILATLASLVEAQTGETASIAESKVSALVDVTNNLILDPPMDLAR